MIPSAQMEKAVSEDLVAGMFNRIAKRYDFLNHLLSLNIDKIWRRALVESLPRGCEDLLDVATGTGDVLLEVAKRRPDIRNLNGSDISEGMLAIGRQKLDASGLRKVPLKHCNAEALAFSDSSFDAVTIAFGLRNVVHKDAALRDFGRVLRNGAQLSILEFFQPPNTALASLFQIYFHKVLPFIGGLLSDREAYRYLPKSVENFYSESELITQLKASGFSQVSVRNFLFGACKLITAQKASKLPCCSATQK